MITPFPAVKGADLGPFPVIEQRNIHRAGDMALRKF
jgi:hypothetical protein